jgi:hypothetical protein
MADKKYVSARDGKNNSVIYVAADGAEFLHSGGTRAWRNNNPGNLIASEKSGLSIGKGGRFAAFASHDDGIAALKFSLTHFYSDKKLDEVFKKYAPATDDNDPEHYIVLVKKFSGLDSTRTIGSLTDDELGKFIASIERVEGWKEGKVEAIPHAQQFIVKGVDDKPLCGLDYEVSYLTCKGEEKKLRGKTDEEGKTGVAVTDTRAPVTLKLPRPDPGQSLKGTGLKTKAGDQKQVIAAEVKAKPWYDRAFSLAADSEDDKNDGGQEGRTTAKNTATPVVGTSTPTPIAPLTIVKQAGAVQASVTRNKVENHVAEVIKESGVYVTWEFDTNHGSGKVLDGLPYFIAEMSGNQAKPLEGGQRICLMKHNKIRQKVPFGKEVALFLGNDAKPQYRSKALYRVKAEEGLTDVVVKIVETEGLVYDATEETASNGLLAGTKKTFSAKLYGTTWMSFSHRFTEAEAVAECAGESEELRDAMKQIYGGGASVGSSSISLGVVKPNKKPLKILWRSAAFDNCKRNIPAITGLAVAKDELIPRVHPQTYKAFLKAAIELDAEELEIASGWRPMLGSVLHRIGVGLDVAIIKVNGASHGFSRVATGAEQEYKNLMAQKKDLAKKKNRTAEESTRLNEIKAVETTKANAADRAIHDNESSTIRNFTAKLRENGDVRQTFDPWEMDANTSDEVAAAPNRLVTGNETLHRNHLHITVKDPDLGY